MAKREAAAPAFTPAKEMRSESKRSPASRADCKVSFTASFLSRYLFLANQLLLANDSFGRGVNGPARANFETCHKRRNRN